ncbi:MAG TPA: hypothetical protein PKI03_38765, partial [Pseudomonadota bacterium]|nr:hypothetical protein [Pseudomonadota bacterium]
IIQLVHSFVSLNDGLPRRPGYVKGSITARRDAAKEQASVGWAVRRNQAWAFRMVTCPARRLRSDNRAEFGQIEPA